MNLAIQIDKEGKAIDNPNEETNLLKHFYNNRRGLI